jgi:hypothetical protein
MQCFVLTQGMVHGQLHRNGDADFGSAGLRHRQVVQKRAADHRMHVTVERVTGRGEPEIRGIQNVSALQSTTDHKPDQVTHKKRRREKSDATRSKQTRTAQGSLRESTKGQVTNRLEAKQESNPVPCVFRRQISAGMCAGTLPAAPEPLPVVVALLLLLLLLLLLDLESFASRGVFELYTPECTISRSSHNLAYSAYGKPTKTHVRL